MNDILSTFLKKETWNFFKNIFIILLFLFAFQPFLKVSAQDESEEKIDSIAARKLILKLQKNPVPHTWESRVPLTNISQCPNSDFSYGSFINWNGCYGTWCNDVNRNQTRCTGSGPYTPFCDPCVILSQTWSNNPTGGHFSIQTPGADPCITGLTTVFPGDSYSALIGNRTCSSGGGGYVDKLTYHITYDPNNSFFIYRCAVVLENPNDPSHNTPDRKPRFTLEIKDDITQVLIDPVCGFYDLYPGDGITNWQNGPGDFLWKDWSTIGIDLSALSGLTTGQVLDVVFTVHGCAMTAHTAYAYVSAVCGSMSIQNTGCNGSGSVTLTGPPGFTNYQWQGPYCPSCPPSPPTYTGNPITFTTAQGAVTGNIFTLTLTALNGCTVQNVQQIIAFTTIHAGFIDTLGCSQRPSHFYDTTTVSQNSVIGWRWFFGDPASGTLDSSHLQNPVHSFTAAGTYTVKLIAYSTEGCPDTTTRVVNIGDLVTITNTTTRSQGCSGIQTNLQMTSNFVDALYTWTATASSPMITGYSGNAVPNPGLINQTLVNNGTQIDSVTYVITPHEGSCNGDPYTYRVVVFPKPVTTFNPHNPTICSNQTTNCVLSSGVTGTTFAWTATCDSADVGGYGPGTGNVIAQTITQPGYAVEIVKYYVVPTANSCPGDTTLILFTVNPKPHLVTSPMNQTMCSNDSTHITLISSCPGTSFTWTTAVVTGNITGNTGGAGSSIVQKLTNNLATQGQVNYIIHFAAGTCIGTDTIYAVFVNPKPHVTNNPLNASVCSNSATNIVLQSDVANPTYTWTATGSSGNVSGYSGGSGPSIIQTLVNAGAVDESVRYHIVASANGCHSDSTTFVVTVHPLPHPAIGGSPSVCVNTTTAYTTTAGMSNYTWTVAGGGNIISGGTTNTINVHWPTKGTDTVFVSYTDGFGCTAASPGWFKVIVDTLPNPTLIGNFNVCIHSSYTYTTDAGYSAYAWVISAGGTKTGGGGPTDNTVTILWNTAGPQTVSVNYQQGPGCTASSPKVQNITVNNLPSVGIGSGATPVCNGSTGVVYTGPAGMTGYIWAISPGGTITSGGTATDNTATVTWNTAGPQTISLNYTDANGCTAPAPMVYPVTVNPLPTASISGPNTVCQNAPSPMVTFTGASSTAPYTFTYNINGGANQQVTTVVGNSVTVAAPTNVVGSFTYNLVSVQDASSTTCSQTQPGNVLITVNPLPTATILGNTTVCQNDPSPLITFTGASSTAPYTFTYNINGGGNQVVTTLVGNSITVPAPTNISGIFTYNLLSVQDASSTTCSQPQAGSAIVTVNPLPTASISGTVQVCQNAPSPLITFTGAAGTAPYTFTYNINGGANLLVTTVVGNSVTVAAPTNGVGPFSYNLVSVKDASSTTCSQLQGGSALITVNPLPTATISGNFTVCQNAPSPLITFTGASGTPPYTFTYNINGGGNQFVTTIVGNSVTVAAPTNVTGVFTYNLLSVQDGSGTACSQPQVGSAIVHINLLPTATIGGTNDVCQNGVSPLITFTGAATTPPYTFTYNINGGANQVVTTVIGSSVTVAAPTNIVGTFTYNLLSVQDGSATTCSQAQGGSAIITVHPLPTATISGLANVCQNAPSPMVTFTGASATAPYTFTYNINGGANQLVTSVGNSVTVAVPTNVVGPFTYNLISVKESSSTTCSQPQGGSVLITVNPLPTATIAGTNQVCQNAPSPLITFTGASSTAPYTFTYNINGGSNQVVTTVVGNSVTVPAPTNVVGSFTYNLISVQDGSATTCSQAQPGSAMITVNPLPTASINGNTAVCQNAPSPMVTFTGASSTAPYTFTYNINGGANQIVTSVGNNVTVAAPTNIPGTYVYNLISVKDASATTCSQNQGGSATIIVNPLPIPTITGPLSVCANSIGTYSTEAAMTNYTWSISGGGVITAGGGTNNITVQWGAAIGTYSIQVNYINANGCTAAAPTPASIIVNTLPVPNFLTGLTSLCSGLSSTYSTDNGMSNYSWTVSAGGSITAGGGPADNTVTVLWNTAGAQTVTVNYVMGTGCSAAAPSTDNITVKPRPSITNAANSTLCSPGKTSIMPSADLGGSTYSWTATGSSGNITGFNAGAGFIIADSLKNTGFNIENVNYSVTPSLNGCAGTASSYIVTVNPIADVYFNPNGQSFCSGGTTNISILSHVIGTTYTWTATGSSGNVSGYSAGSGNLIAQTLNNSGPWFENVHYTVSSVANSCAGNTGLVIVNMNPTPQVAFNMSCNDVITTTDAKSFTLRGGIPLGGNYSGTGVNAGIFYPSLAGAGTITINYSYANTWGCNANQSQTITVTSAVPFNCDNVLTDLRDGSRYNTIKLGTQCWMAQNLNFGTQIPSSAVQRDNCVVEKYCLSDITANCPNQGGLYQWDEMMRYQDTPALQGLCPPAWHVPTEGDWSTLFNFYTSNGFAGSPLKSSGFSGFNADLNGLFFDNTTWKLNGFATFMWSSTSDGLTKAWAHAMNNPDPSVSTYPGNRSNAFYIRCIKD